MPCSDGPADSATRPSGCWTVSPDPASGRRFSQSPTPAPVPDKRKQNHFHREPRSARRTRDSPLPAPPSAQWPPARNGPFYTATMPCARFPQAPVPASGGRFSPGPIPAPTWDIRTRGHSRRGSPISRRTGQPHPETRDRIWARQLWPWAHFHQTSRLLPAEIVVGSVGRFFSVSHSFTSAGYWEARSLEPGCTFLPAQ